MHSSGTAECKAVLIMLCLRTLFEGLQAQLLMSALVRTPFWLLIRVQLFLLLSVVCTSKHVDGDISCIVLWRDWKRIHDVRALCLEQPRANLFAAFPLMQQAIDLSYASGSVARPGWFPKAVGCSASHPFKFDGQGL